MKTALQIIFLAENLNNQIMKGNYAVLTPEKIEEIFKDLEEKLLSSFMRANYSIAVREYIKSTIEFKKQELLKSIQK